MREFKTLKCIKNVFDTESNLIFAAGNTYKAMRRHVFVEGGNDLIPVLRMKNELGKNFIVEDKNDSSHFNEYFEVM